MTIGEKIQFYRKHSGLSQEELGNKLLISRQTISLWEMDKTVPTVDNLIRLKEIFGVSVDEILSGEEISTAESHDVPKESYAFSFNKKEAKEAVSPSVKRGFYVPIPFLLFAAIFSFINFIAGEESSSVIYLFISLFVYPPTVIALLIVSQRVIKKLADNMRAKEYYYTLFDEAMNVEIYKNDTLIKTYVIRYDAIENVKASNSFISFNFDSQRFVIKRDILVKNSIIEALAKSKPKKEKRLKTYFPLRVISWVLFTASIATFFIFAILIAILSSINNTTVANMWIGFPIALIPATSAIFGIVLKIKKHKGATKNIIVGFIMMFMLCMYGMFYFVFPESHDDTQYLKAQEVIGIELPKYSNVVLDYTQEETRVYLDSIVAETFEEELKSNTRWLSGVPTSMKGLLPSMQAASASTYEYCIIYNINDGTSNELPSKEGMQSYITILYDSDNDCFLIIEYEIEYTK